MNKQRTVILGVIVTALAAIFAFLGLTRGKNSQLPYIPPARPAQTATPSPSLLALAFPSPTPTADLAHLKNCTYTDYFWQTHPEAWPDQVEIAGQIITKDLAAKFMQSPSDDPVLELRRVLYVALVNIHFGANRSPVDGTIQKAADWLATHASGENLAEFDRSVLNLLILDLENFNNGMHGPDLCPNQPETSPSSAITKIQAQLTQTRPVASLTPNAVQAATTLASTPFVPVYERAATPEPTQEPPAPPPANPPVIPTPILSPSATPTSGSKPPTSAPTLAPPASTATPQPTSTPFTEPSKTPKPKPTHKPKN